MKTDRHGLFTELDPPPGGPERFAKRLDEPRRAPPGVRRWVVASAGAAAAAMVLAAIVLTREPGDSTSPAAPDTARIANLYEAPQFDRLLGRPTPPTALTVTHNDTPANVTEIETANEKVRLYQIE